MVSHKKGRSRKRKERSKLPGRVFLAALVIVAVLLIFFAVWSLTKRHLSDHVEYPEGSHAWWDFGWGGREDESSVTGTLPEGSAEVVEGPEGSMAETKEAESSASPPSVISYGEPSEELFARLLEDFMVPEDHTETPDYGYSLDADDYADTGGTAQGVLEVDETVPDGCITLSAVALPEAVANTPEMYTYDEMLSDLEALQLQYGSLLLDDEGLVHSTEAEALDEETTAGQTEVRPSEADSDIENVSDEAEHGEPDEEGTKEPSPAEINGHDSGSPLMKMMSAGKTYDDREIMVIYVGNLQAEHNVMITGAIHAREYITADLVMKQLGMLLEAAASGAAFDGKAMGEWLNEVCFTFIPMCDPDGVSISQFGLDGLSDPVLKANVRAAYENDLAAGKEDASQGFDYFTRRWKANARGVNLNENFNALWERIPGGMSAADLEQLSRSEERKERAPDGSFEPASAGATAYMSGGSFKGEAPCSEVETKILTIIADLRHYEAAVHYHAMGEVIYWDICNNRLREHARDLSNQIMVLTGYRKEVSDDGGGYKDYFHLKEDPAASVTVEVGSTPAPVDPAGMPAIWQQNIMVPYQTMKWTKEKGR